MIRWSVVLMGLLGNLMCISGCSSDTTGPKPVTPTNAYWVLRLNEHAVTLALTAPANTVRLHAIPFNAEGDSLPGLGLVQYMVSDSTLQVDSTGLVTAKYVSFEETTTYEANSFVVASFTDAEHQLTIVDTCYVQVTAAAPASPLAFFSIQPKGGDSAKRAISTNGANLYRTTGALYATGVSARDSADATFTSFLTYFTSSDPSIARIDHWNGAVHALRTGHVTLYARTWAYGVVKQDSLVFEVTPTVSQTITVLAVIPTGSHTPVLTFWPLVATVSTGAIVTWTSASLTDSIDVVFDDPAHIDSARFMTSNFSTGRGNILPWMKDSSGTSAIGSLEKQFYVNMYGATLGAVFYNFSGAAGSRARTFPVAGTYHYHSSLYPTSHGTIVVE